MRSTTSNGEIEHVPLVALKSRMSNLSSMSILIHYNCYQAVISALTSPENPEIFKSENKFSGGHAPNNLCGAIYALVQQFPNKQEELINKFREKTGGTTCKELKWGEIGCSELVDVAIGLVQ
ncbi:Conserved_hypothetical protein [Hexamita inflata]|uniref:Uncharacterized protein n=1 Tax=Hexamita inflata TaxID=28002 RepID=A0AA86P8P5_9EUKA|nr:Conserved hypothetical protein [Hexamita inflata]